MKSPAQISRKKISDAMSWLGSQRSEKKSAAAKANGKLGGRPKTKKETPQ